MNSEEIKAMFQANAALKQSFPTDPNYPTLLEATQKLTAKYIQESFKPGDIEQSKRMTDEEAVTVLLDACKIATDFEAKEHPNGMTDEQVAETFKLRKSALDFIVDRLVSIKQMS